MMALLGLFGMFRAAKFWVAVVMAAVQFIQIYSGVDLGLDEGTVTAILGGLTALLVWLVPNAKKKEVEPVNDPNYFPPRPGLY